ncbi:hypothetical protein H6P81_000096 [Aristolochia fimbriata]|uniref:Uncharacterized protein n=1 Tax=Aristolochia fimbriata TaxID=158543 RepID=A0AAV7F3E1_ARIFI|nr:hypothetical protein H6P81_000096 [Aristolochia fimbriata]
MKKTIYVKVGRYYSNNHAVGKVRIGKSVVKTDIDKLSVGHVQACTLNKETRITTCSSRFTKSFTTYRTKQQGVPQKLISPATEIELYNIVEVFLPERFLYYYHQHSPVALLPVRQVRVRANLQANKNIPPRLTGLGKAKGRKDYRLRGRAEDLGNENGGNVTGWKQEAEALLGFKTSAGLTY